MVGCPVNPGQSGRRQILVEHLLGTRCHSRAGNSAVRESVFPSVILMLYNGRQALTTEHVSESDTSGADGCFEEDRRAKCD